MMRRALAVVLGCSLSLLSAGCWDRTEINDLGLVTAVALDKGVDDKLRLTVQMIIPKNLPGGGGKAGGGGSSGGEVTFVRSSEGLNMADALSKLQRITPRKIFWGQCKVFIFGEELAQKDIMEPLDFLIRYPQPRERGYLFVAKGAASDVLALVPPLERTSAEVLRELNKLTYGMQVTMKEFADSLSADPHTAVLPFVHILPREKGAKPLQTVPYIAGAAVFQKNKMSDVLPDQTARGMLWVREQVKDFTVTFPSHLRPSGEISLRPVQSDLKLIPSIEQDKYKMTISILTEGDIIQNNTPLDPGFQSSLTQMEALFAHDVQERIATSVDEIQHRYKVDVLGFAEAFRRQYPEQWKQIKDRWDEYFPKVEVQVVITAHIRRSGVISNTGGIPTEER